MRRLSLEVQQGEIFGLLGPNGSGKTTTIRLLLGLLRPTSGQATIFGLDCWRQSLRVRRLVSYLPGELRMYGSMSGFAVLRFLSDLREGDGLDRAVAIAERMMGLNLRKKVRAYSTGMKQKLALALAFADPVDILILDEPTSALDPSARAEVLQPGEGGAGPGADGDLLGPRLARRSRRSRTGWRSCGGAGSCTSRTCTPGAACGCS